MESKTQRFTAFGSLLSRCMDDGLGAIPTGCPWTPASLAKKSGVDERTIRNYCQGKHRPNARLLFDLLGALKLDPEHLSKKPVAERAAHEAIANELRAAAGLDNSASQASTTEQASIGSTNLTDQTWGGGQSGLQRVSEEGELLSDAQRQLRKFLNVPNGAGVRPLDAALVKVSRADCSTVLQYALRRWATWEHLLGGRVKARFVPLAI